eukprot:15447860-Alexandrium_andersonii.AAC.1
MHAYFEAAQSRRSHHRGKPRRRRLAEPSASKRSPRQHSRQLPFWDGIPAGFPPNLAATIL